MLKKTVYTAKEVSKLLYGGMIHPQKLREMVHSGKIPSVDTGSKRILIPAAWIAEEYKRLRGDADTVCIAET